MKKIIIRIAENDDNGDLSRRATQIAFDDIVLLESDSFERGEKLSHITTKKGHRRFRLHRKEYLYFNRLTWNGSMAWNGYLMDTLYANELLNNLNKSGKWSFNELYTEIEDIFNNKEPLLQGDFERIFVDSIIA